MIKFLERRYYKQNGGNKYHIDCNKIEQDPNLLDINKIVQYKNEVAILSGILKDINDGKLEEISKIRQIVVKIGQVGKTLEKEFGIGSLINKHNIPGFINYICLFDCYDDTYKKDLPIKQICDAPKIDSNIRKVLIMPYVIEGSIKHYNWDLKDKEDNKVNFIELVGIINRIEEYKNKKEHHINAFNIVKIINESPIKIIRNPKQNLVYNPNII